MVLSRDRLRHGRWLPWLKYEFGWDRSRAWRFMLVYEVAKENPKLLTVSNLMLDAGALYCIAAPKTPEPARTEVIERLLTGRASPKCAICQKFFSRIESRKRTFYVQNHMRHRGANLYTAAGISLNQ